MDKRDYPGTYPDRWQPVLLHQYLLQFAQLTPDAIAIVAPKEQWSYQDLQDYASAYADQLSQSGLGGGDRVILELEASPQAIALIIACSLLGIVFIPLSPETPYRRIAQIIQITEAKLHIQSSSKQPKVFDAAQILSGLIEDSSLVITGELSPESHSRPGAVLESDLAYIIFTSGTTGAPKGIMMSHRAVLVFFRALVNYCDLATDARVGTIAPLQFDFSLLDLGLALGSGATLVQIPRRLTLIPQKLWRYLNQQQVSQLNCVPSVWQLLLYHVAQDVSHLKYLKTTLFAGEPFAIADVIRLQSLLPHLRIINCFGQSESIACSFTEVPNPLPPDSTKLAIGSAHPGAEMLLLNEKQQEIIEIGEIGEIYLRGANLFSGYWRDRTQTDAALVLNPLNPHLGEKVFRTGDLAYKGCQGEVYLAGRRDLQVKIRGNRVELAEVESRLEEHPDLNQAVAIALNRRKETIIIACLVSKSAIKPSVAEIRLFCAETLHSYAIPAEIYFLDSLPLTINGKIDRHALKVMLDE